MKTKKMSLKEIQGVLSREEMKKIMAGSGTVVCNSCNSDSDCDYKPDLYCGSSDACPQYFKVCKRFAWV